mgnify:CR=1 FL=1|tara:strand:- start:154 stop:348 length:195 start_codon:yes stop_codon:yes gene_type:complete
MKYFLTGIGIFAGMFGLFAGIEYLLSDVLQQNKQFIGTLLLIGLLLIIAKPFGELTFSVFKLEK